MIAKLALRPDEAAEVSGMSRTRIFALIKDGAIDSIKEGNARLILVASLARYLERRAAEQSGRAS